MQRFTDLIVWQRSHTLALTIYRLSSAFPGEERFGITSQLRRAAVSVPTNLAEGSKRKYGSDYARSVNIAEGSLAEVEYLLILSCDLGFIAVEQAKPLTDEITEIAKMLYALRTKIEAS